MATMSKPKTSKYNKYTSSGKARKAAEGKRYVLPLTLNDVNMIIKYVFSVDLDRQRATSLKKLLYAVDYTVWLDGGEKFTIDSYEIYKRFMFLKNCVDMYLSDIRDREILLNATNNCLKEDERLTFSDFDYNPAKLMTEGELRFIEERIANYLDNLFIWDNGLALSDNIAMAFASTNNDDRGKALSQIRSIIKQAGDEFRRNSDRNGNKSMFVMTPERSVMEMMQTRDELLDTTKRLKTGSRALNMITGGGFEGGAVYIFAGPAGTGKSLLAHNICLQLRSYNSNYRTKDPTKIPCVVYLTMENTMKQTNQRTFFMAAGSTKVNPADYNEDKIMEMMMSSNFVPRNERDIHFIVHYVPNRSVDTTYLYTLYEELLHEGYEMIALVQDHIKRIKSEEYTAEPRFELGNVVNEFKVFAAKYDIPVITLAHINRTGIAKIDSDNKTYDLVRGLTRDTIGESMLMLDNCDTFVTVCTEYSERWGERRWMGMKVPKSRSSDASDLVIFTPFENGDSIRLAEDCFTEPAFRYSLNPNVDEQGNSYKQKGNGMLSAYQVNNQGYQDKVDEMTSKTKDGVIDNTKKKKKKDSSFGYFGGKTQPVAKEATSNTADVDELFKTLGIPEEEEIERVIPFELAPWVLEGKDSPS